MGWMERLRGLLEVSEENVEEYEEPEYVVPDVARVVFQESSGEPVENVFERLVSAGLSGVEACRALYYGNKYGEVRLRELSPPRSLVGFVASWHCSWAWAVVVFLVVTSLSVFVLPPVEPWIYLRYVFGAVYVLYVPGAVFIEALYPQRVELEDLERFALGVGLSLALVPLVGLFLNYTPWGIRLNPVYFGLSLLTLTLLAVAVARKYSYHLLSLEGLHD